MDKKLEKAVDDFENEMKRVLENNSHKTGWDEMSIHALYKRIKDEFEEFQEQYILLLHSYLVDDPSFEQRTIQRLRNEAIDMSEFCMFLCYNYPNKPNIKKSEMIK